MKGKLNFIAGVVMGIALFCCTGAASAVVETLTATPTTQTFWVNDQQVQLEAYAIGGYNYVKLRDIGQVVDFNVCYDPARNAAIIEPDKPYVGEDYQAAPTEVLANGKPITEENVLELLHSIENDWPSGTVWGKHTTPDTNFNQVPSTESRKVMSQYNVSSVYACGGYAAMVSSLLFGDETNPARKVDNVSHIRPGDIVLLVKETGKVSHVVVAVEAPNEEGRFHVTDGNCGAQVHWPERDHLQARVYSTAGTASCHVEVWTRYPESHEPTGDSVGAWK